MATSLEAASGAAGSSGLIEVTGLFRRIAYTLRVWMLDVSFHPVAGPMASAGVFLVSVAVRLWLPGLSLSLLCWSHREVMRSGRGGFPASRLHDMIERTIRRACTRGGLAERVTASRTGRQTMDRHAIIAGIVLKAPRFGTGRVIEKGVLLLKNNERIDSFCRSVDIGAVLRNYALVLEPSWSGYADTRFLALTTFRDHPILVMSPCRADYDFLQRLGSNLHPVAMGASNWVDPRIFRPLPGHTKRFDAVMIARFTLIKRYHALFRAVRRINDPSYQVVVVAGDSRSADDREVILSMIGSLGLAKQITVLEDLDPTEVNTVLNESRVNLLLSREEGSNRSLFEGFFAGVPGLALRNHIGMPLDYFTPETGRLVGEDELVEALIEFRERYSDFSPRPWALRNIAPEVSANRLNRVLKELAENRGEVWTRDIVAKCNRPEMHYYPDERAGDGLPPADGDLAVFPPHS